MIKINNLNKSYGELEVFHNLNIDFNENRITGILGSSGCGKTTLLNIISGLVDYDSGDINGVNTKSISYIFQEPRLLEWMTVRGNIEFVLREKYDKEEYTKIIDEILKLVNLYDFVNYIPSQLSGGMKQRVSIARAFAYPSKILLMDEPFKGLDINLKRSLINSFIDLWTHKKKTVIFISHDIDEMLMICEEIYILGSNPTQVIEEIKIDIPHIDRNKDGFKQEYLNRIKKHFQS